MTKTSELKTKAILYSVLTLLTAALVYLLTSKCPYLSDDWHFFFVFESLDPLKQNQRVQSFSDILQSLRNYYQLSGGRVVAHFLVFCLIQLNKQVFNILNGIVYAAMCWLLYRIAQALSGSRSIWLYPLTILLSFCFMPVFGDVVLWLSGSVNYLWMSLPFFGCINWLLRRFESAGTAERLCILPLFLLSGATNEITGGMLGVALILCFFFSEKKQISSLILPLAALIPGICLVVLAPGNTIRQIFVAQEDVTPMRIFLSFLGYVLYLTKYDGILLMPVLSAFLLHKHDKTISRKDRLRPLILFTVGFAGLCALSLIGACYIRAMFFSILLLIPSALDALIRLIRMFRNPQNDKAKLFRDGVCIGLLEAGVFSLCYGKLAVLCGLSMILVLLICRIKAEKLFGLALKAKNFRKFLIPVTCMIFCCLLGMRTYIYFQWSDKYSKFEEFEVQSLLHDQLDEAATVIDESVWDKKCNLIPFDSSAGNPWFRVEWMAEYYGKQGYLIAEKYSDTYEPYLEYLESHKQS